MRILSAHSPSFHRRGYHQGSVWPLYTGWTALAEYRYGRPVQGYTRIMNNLLIKEHWNRGYVEEVMDGAAYEPAGVCSHQCWSETNAIHPVMEGLLGWFPDAPAGKAGLHPRLPVQWDSLEVRNLRCGEQRLSVRFVRSEERQRWVFSRSGRGSLELHFAPQLAAGERITGARVGGAELALPAGRRRGLPEPAFRLDIGDSLVLDLRTQGGLSLLPLVPRPRPGDPSGRLRIVDQSYRDGVLTAELEGPSGGSGLFRVRPLAGQDLRIEGRVYRSEGARLPVGFHVAFPPSAQDWSRTTIRIEEVP
jgi:hypothetical protein